jgi:hypothetical protein
LQPVTAAQHLRGWEARRQAIAQATEKAGRTGDLLARHGIECPTAAGAGTGTFEFETASGVYTEFTMRVLHLDIDGAPTKAFEPSRLWGRRR